MSTFDSHDLDVSEQLGSIKEGIEHIKERLRDMQDAWHDRIAQRDKQQKEVDERLKSLEYTRKMQYGIFVGIGAVVSIIVEFILKVVLR